jgi:hypothetical protein
MWERRGGAMAASSSRTARDAWCFRRRELAGVFTWCHGHARPSAPFPARRPKKLDVLAWPSLARPVVGQPYRRCGRRRPRVLAFLFEADSRDLSSSIVAVSHVKRTAAEQNRMDRARVNGSQAHSSHGEVKAGAGKSRTARSPAWPRPAGDRSDPMIRRRDNVT